MKEEGKRQKEEGIPLAEWVVPRVEKAMPADFPDEPYLGLDDIEAHTTRLLGSKSAADMKSAAKRFYPGDVLYSRLRPYLNKVWLADRSGLCSAELIVLPSNDFIDGSFLKYRLNAMDFVSFANSLNAGDRPRVDFDQISAFCLPPFALARQRRIVSKIEELFSKLDAGESALKKARHQLGVYRQSLLKQAFEGKLTAPWRAQHPNLLESPDQLLARIAQPDQPRGGREPSIEVIEGVGGLAVNYPKKKIPTGWRWTPLLRIARQETGHTPSRNHPEYWDGPFKWIGIPDARQHHGGVVNDTLQTITQAGLDNSSARLLPERTVCLSRTASVGYVCVMGKSMATSQDFATWTCTEALIPEFLMYAILAEGAEIRRFGKGTTHTTIYFPEIRALHIALPAPAEQQEIVRMLDAQFEVIEQNEREIDAALKRSEALRQSILKRAFTGQLVPQDPTDEPASDLLERIREGRSGGTNFKFTGIER